MKHSKDNGSTSLMDMKARLVNELRDPDYRRAFVQGHAQDSIAFQLRAMRQARKKDQGQMAEKAFGDAKLQPMISRYENPDYGKYSVTTLLDLAAAFDVALVVHFAPFGELVEWDARLKNDPNLLNPQPFEDELPELECTASDSQFSMAETGTASLFSEGDTRVAYAASAGTKSDFMRTGTAQSMMKTA